MEKFIHILTYIGLFIWQLPQNLLAICIMPFIGTIHFVCYRNYCLCLRCSDIRGGISLGNFALISNRLSEDECDISHEVDGHTKQSKMLGPFYLLVIGIPSLCWAMFRNRESNPNYYSFYTEHWANNLAGLEAYQPYQGINYYKLRKKES